MRLQSDIFGSSFLFCSSRHPAIPTKINKPADKGGFLLDFQYLQKVRKLEFRKTQFFDTFELIVAGIKNKLTISYTIVYYNFC